MFEIAPRRNTYVNAGEECSVYEIMDENGSV